MRCAVVYLQVSGVRDDRGAAHALSVAATGAALHLDAGRPQHEVTIAAVQHLPGDLDHLGTNFALSLLSQLGICGAGQHMTECERGGIKEQWATEQRHGDLLEDLGICLRYCAFCLR